MQIKRNKYESSGSCRKNADQADYHADQINQTIIIRLNDKNNSNKINYMFKLKL